jgi:hypothetical protein
MIERAKAAQRDPDPRHKPGMLDIAADLSQIQGEFQALLKELKKEAEACAPCQPYQDKYEALAKEWEAYRSEMYGTPGGKQLFGILEALRTGNWSGPAPPTEAELEQMAMASVRGRVEGHCQTVFGPLNRLEFLAPADKRQIQLDPQKFYAFSKPWYDRIYACLGKLDTKVLYAQHRLALGRCLTAHDYDKVQHTPGVNAYQMQAEKEAFGRCMNENDVATAACTEDFYISYWVSMRKDPTLNRGPGGTCAPVVMAVALPRVGIYATRPPEIVQLEIVRKYAADTAKMAELEKEAAGTTPATFGIDGTVPHPVSPLPASGAPVNSLGVPVGATFTMTTGTYRFPACDRRTTIPRADARSCGFSGPLVTLERRRNLASCLSGRDLESETLCGGHRVGFSRHRFPALPSAGLRRLAWAAAGQRRRRADRRSKTDGASCGDEDARHCFERAQAAGG